MSVPTKPAVVSTPGPWRSSARTFRTHTHSGRAWERSIATADGVIVATAFGSTPEEAEANAERIAQLPALVGSLSVDDIDQIVEAIEHFVMGGVEDIWQPYVDKLQALRSAIVRAEGQS